MTSEAGGRVTARARPTPGPSELLCGRHHVSRDRWSRHEWRLMIALTVSTVVSVPDRPMASRPVEVEPIDVVVKPIALPGSAVDEVPDMAIVIVDNSDASVFMATKSIPPHGGRYVYGIRGCTRVALLALCSRRPLVG